MPGVRHHNYIDALRVQIPMTAICSVYAGVFAVIAFGLARGAGSWLVNPAICWLGKVSFSAYLWHFAVLSLAAPTIGSFPGTLAYLIAVTIVLTITLVTSTVTYLCIERPMIRAGSKLATRLRHGLSGSSGMQHPAGPTLPDGSGR